MRTGSENIPEVAARGGPGHRRRAAALPAIAAAFALAGCADTGTRVLPAYTLANGAVLQDVVSVAADPSGGAPVVISLSTFDVGASGRTELVSRETSSAPGPGLLVASALGGALPTAAAIVGIGLAHGGEDGDTFVNSSYSTAGNTASGGDAGDIDAVSAACGRNCSVSN